MSESQNENRLHRQELAVSEVMTAAVAEALGVRPPLRVTRVVAMALCKANGCTLCDPDPARLCRAHDFYRQDVDVVVYALTRARLLKGT